MRKLMFVGIAAAIVAVVSVLSGSLVVAHRQAGNPDAPSIDPLELTLKAGKLPTLEVKDLV